MNTLFLTWQDVSNSRSWFVIGRINKTDTGYRFQYVNQALAAFRSGFIPLPEFPDIYEVYESPYLFPILTNRLLPKSRPDYNDSLLRVGVGIDDADYFTILSRTGGIRATDNIGVFPESEPDEQGNYQIVFFANGLRHLPIESENEVLNLVSGTQLEIVCDDANDSDRDALLIYSNRVKVGWIPRFYCKDIRYLLGIDPETVVLKVMQVNPRTAPIQQRLLCSLTSPWPESWEPFNHEDFKTISKEVSQV